MNCFLTLKVQKTQHLLTFLNPTKSDSTLQVSRVTRDHQAFSLAALFSSVTPGARGSVC